MKNVQCAGSEENLDRCSFDWVMDGACSHTMDAVVECYGDELTGNASTPEQCTIDMLQELLALAREELKNERDVRVRAQVELNDERDAIFHDINELNTTLSNERDARVHDMNLLNMAISSR